MKKLLCVFVGIIFCCAIYGNPLPDPEPYWVDITTLGVDGDDIIEDIALSGTNLYSVGAFTGAIVSPPNTLISAGGTDVFIGASQGLPTILYINEMVGFGGSGDDHAYKVVLDSNGNRYVTGYFETTAWFGTSYLTSAGGKDVFVIKIDPGNNVIWAASAGGIGDDWGIGIGIDTSGFLYLTGQFEDSCSFGSSATTSNGGYDVFCSKLDTQGNWLWASAAGGVGTEDVCDIITDNAGNSYIAGAFYNTAVFTPYLVQSTGDSDIYTAKINSSGEWLWVNHAGSSGNDTVKDLYISGSNDKVITGLYSDEFLCGGVTLYSPFNQRAY